MEKVYPYFANKLNRLFYTIICMLFALFCHGQNADTAAFKLPAILSGEKTVSGYLLITFPEPQPNWNPKNVKWLNKFQAIVPKNERLILPQGSTSIKIEAGFKLGTFLKQSLLQKSIPAHLVISLSDTANKQNWPKRLLQKLHYSGYSNVFSIKLPTAGDLQFLLNQPEVMLAEAANRNARPELSVSTLDLSINKIALAHRNWPDITGKGLVLSIKENLFDTLDIDFRKRFIFNTLADTKIDRHASIMATMAAGAGNSVFPSKGAAPGAKITGATFSNLMPEPPTYYQNLNISVQNHSYGVGVETNYGIDAAAYDESVWKDSSLLHVFSAGNSGTLAATSGIYQNLAGFANLTGSFKTCKNGIVVAATNAEGQLETASSKGPVQDGRIKPEIHALGEDGTSGAAALVSGSSLLLQHAIFQKDGKPASAALIKSLLINGSTDIGTPGPDFAGGFGALDADASLQMVNQNTYRQGSVANNQPFTHQITVPAGSSRVCITLAYTDSAAAPEALRPLLNDLDLTVTGPSGIIYLPWVLQTTPNAAALSAAATRGRDSLNNVEQVSIEFPDAGIYTITIAATKLLSNRISFAYSWQTNKANSLAFTYPLKTEAVSVQEKWSIRWQQQFPPLATGDLAFQPLHNAAPIAIQNQLLLSQLQTTWQPPITLPEAGFFTMKIGNQIFNSDTILSGNSIQPKIGYLCADSVAVFWPKQTAATSYSVEVLNDSTYQKIASVTDTFYVANRASLPTDWFKITPVSINGLLVSSGGFKAGNQAVGCYIKSFYTNYIGLDTADILLELGTLFNVQQVNIEKQENNQFIPLASFNNASQVSYFFTDRFLKEGNNSYRASILLKNGTRVYSDVQTIFHTGSGRFFLFPNPVKRGHAATLINNLDSLATLQLINMQGQLIHQQLLKNYKEPIATHKMPAGIYLMIIKQKSTILHRRKMVVY